MLKCVVRLGIPIGLSLLPAIYGRDIELIGLRLGLWRFAPLVGVIVFCTVWYIRTAADRRRVAAASDDPFTTAPGLQEVLAMVCDTKRSGQAPHVLVGISTGGLLAASLLSRCARISIPLGCAVRSNPRKQGLVSGPDEANSVVLAVTDFDTLRNRLGRDRLQIGLVDDVCHSKTSVEMLLEHLRRYDGIEVSEVTVLAKREDLQWPPDFPPLRAGSEYEKRVPMRLDTERLTTDDMGLDPNAPLSSLLGWLRPRQYSAMVGVGSGGTILAAFLAHEFGVPLGCLTRDDPSEQSLPQGQRRTAILAGPNWSDLFSSGTGPLLLVEDIARTGNTLKLAVETVRRELEEVMLHSVRVDAAALYLGSGLRDDEVVALRDDLTQAGCAKFMVGGRAPRLEFTLPWDVKL